MDPKKKEERQFLDSFRHFCREFPVGKITYGEAPDFIVESERHRIGIEITKIFIDDGHSKTALQAIEAARDRITDLARKFAGEIGTPPRGVTLFFNWTLPLHRKEEPAIARAVAQTVHEKMPPPDENADLECHYGSIQPREVDQILIHRANPVEGFEWKWTEASRRMEDAVSYIADAIARKSKTIIDCLKRCDECWLLIVVGEPLLRASSNINPDERSFNYTYISPFSRTYLLNFGRGSSARLNTRPSAISGDT